MGARWRLLRIETAPGVGVVHIKYPAPFGRIFHRAKSLVLGWGLLQRKLFPEFGHHGVGHAQIPDGVGQ